MTRRGWHCGRCGATLGVMPHRERAGRGQDTVLTIVGAVTVSRRATGGWTLVCRCGEPTSWDGDLIRWHT